MLNPAEMTMASVIQETIGRYLTLEECMRIADGTFFPCTFLENGEIEFSIKKEEAKLTPEDETIIENILSKFKTQGDIINYELVYKNFKGDVK